MSPLAVIGNISCDLAIYADNRQFKLLGGAALYVARAATRAGLAAAPISVIGNDLAWILNDPRLRDIDLTSVKLFRGQSCAFTITYTDIGTLADVECSFGVAESLTDHCLAVIGRHSRYHVCCRRPLDVGAVLSRLARADLTFTADFHLASAGSLISVAAPFLPRAEVVFVNAAEFTLLSSLIDLSSLPVVVVSDGPRKVALLRKGRVVATVRPPGARPVEVTGAGDVLAGTFLAHAADGFCDCDALVAAVNAATQSVQTAGHDISDRQAQD